MPVTSALFHVPTWQDMASIVVVLTAFEGALLWITRNALAKFFVTKTDHTVALRELNAGQVQISDRMEAIEKQVQEAPTAVDFRALSGRVAGLEREVAGVKEAVIATKEGVHRTEHLMGLVLQSLLKREATPE